MSTNNKNIAIIIPVYNDWKSLACLVNMINSEEKNQDFTINEIVIVNDFSTTQLESELDTFAKIHFTQLNTNVGHQRAIAIGLAYLNNNVDQKTDYIAIMDADGQDLPKDIAPLVSKANQENKLIFAKRNKRQESFFFIALYKIYRILFKSLTGNKLSFGNFSCFPKDLLEDILANPNLWNHYSSSVLKSKIPYEYIETDRGERLHGNSKMDFNQLLLHGLSAMAVHIDKVITNVLLFSISGIVLLIILMLTLLLIKFFTNYAIPGWTSNIALALLNIGGILTIIILLLLLIQLNQRRQVHPSVKRFYKDFIKSINIATND